MELFKLFGTIAVKNQEANEAIDDTTDKAENSSNAIIGAFKKIGGVVATAFAVDKIVEFGKSVVDASATVAAEQSAFEQIMGEYSNTAQEKINEIADATGMVSTRLTPYMTSMTAKFKGLGYDISDATDLASDGLNLAADAAAFWDKSLDDSMSALNSFINGSYEGGEAIGLFANDTQMASYAVKEGIVSETKEWANLDEARKQATRLQYAQDMMKASGATGQAAKEAGQYANVQANLNEKWRQFKAQIGEPLLQNIVIPAMDKLSSVVDTASQKFQDLKQWVSENQSTLQVWGGIIVSVTAGLAAMKIALSMGTIINTVTGAITKAKTAFLAFNATLAANPIVLVVAAIAALAAGFIYLWNTSEGFRNFWIGLWETIKSAASGVWEGIKAAADTVINALQTGWQAFSSFFSDLWNGIVTTVSTVWETIKNVVSLGLQTIGMIISAAVQIITIPFQFIWENCKGIILAAWDAIKNVVTTAVNAVKNVITTVFNAIKTYITTVVNLWKTIVSTAWNAIKSVVSTVVNAIKSAVTTAWNAISSVTTSVFNAVKGVVTSVWNAIKSAIQTAVNGVKSVVTSVWNAIKSTTSSVFNGIKSTATSVWNAIKKAIETPINAAKNAVKSAIDKIKSFFNFSWSLPKLKLPHISISGKFSLTPPSVPKFGIEWYAKGGIMEEPTLFGFNGATGKAMVGGEAGAEAIAPIDVLMGYVRAAVQEENSAVAYKLEQLIALLSQYLPEIIKNMAKQIYLDSGVLVGELSNDIDRKMGDIATMRARGM